jgi:hypothetical protein
MSFSIRSNRPALIVSGQIIQVSSLPPPAPGSPINQTSTRSTPQMSTGPRRPIRANQRALSRSELRNTPAASGFELPAIPGPAMRRQSRPCRSKPPPKNVLHARTAQIEPSINLGSVAVNVCRFASPQLQEKRRRRGDWLQPEALEQPGPGSTSCAITPYRPLWPRVILCRRPARSGRGEVD